MEEDSDSDDDIQSEFESYIQQQRKRGIENPLKWWKTVEGIHPQLSKMAKDRFAVPVIGSGVEREFSISGAIVSKGRNRIDPGCHVPAHAHTTAATAVTNNGWLVGTNGYWQVSRLG